MPHARLQIRARRLEGWNESHADTNQGSDREGKEEHRTINANRIHSRQSRRAQSHQGTHASNGNAHPKHAADHGEKQALREQLPDESPFRCAKCGTHGELSASLGAAGKQKVGHVDACDEQNKKHCAEYSQQRRPYAASDIDLQGAYYQTAGGTSGAVVSPGV